MTTNMVFPFAKDGIRSGGEGQWLMVQEILTQFFGAYFNGVAAAEDIFPTHETGIRKLAHERMVVVFYEWVSQIGYNRPVVAGAPGTKAGLAARRCRGQGG